MTTTPTTQQPSSPKHLSLSFDNDIRLSLPCSPESAIIVTKLAAKVQKQIHHEQETHQPIQSSLEYYRILTHFAEMCSNPTNKPSGPWTSRAQYKDVIVQYDDEAKTQQQRETVLVDIARDLYYVELKKERKNTLMGHVGFFMEGTLTPAIGGGAIIHINTRQGRKVAIKSYSKDLIARRVSRDGKEIPENPHIELELQQRLSNPGHPNVCRLLACLESDDTLFAVLPFLHGPDLFDAVKLHGQFPEKEAICMMRQMVSAVEYLHRNGVAHRDLSLENFVLDEENMPVLIDFGVATMLRKRPASEGFAKVQHTGQVGKRKYMAPELWIPLEMTYSAEKADLWSLGVTFFALAVGYPPFSSPDSCDPNYVKACKDRKLWALFKKWQTDGHVTFDLSTDLLNVIQNMLEVRPAHRATLLDVAQSLEIMKNV